MLKWWVGGFRAFLAPCAFICPPSLCSPFSHGLRRMRLSYFFYVSSECGICWLRLCFLLCLTHVWGLTLAVVDSMGPFVTKLTNSNSPDLVREKVNGWSKHSIQSLWTAYCGCELLRILLCIYICYIFYVLLILWMIVTEYFPFASISFTRSLTLCVGGRWWF